MNRDQLVEVLDYFVPREVMGPVIIVFSFENVINHIVTTFVPEGLSFVAWTLIFAATAVLVAVWGGVDDDRDELEDRLDDLE